MEAKISIEIPLEIPFSVINSPSHIKSIAPTERMKAVPSTIARFPVSIADPPSMEFMMKTIQIPWRKAIGKVRYLVY